MANAKISQLPAVTSAAGGDLAVAVASGTTSQITVDNLFKNRTLVAPALGTPASGTLTSCTALPLTTGVTGTLPVANGGTGITSFGTGVATALGVNTGSSGAFVVNGGALGTPSSGTLSSCSGLPISTGVSGLGAGVATFLATPSSANLASAVTGETGTGALVFGTGPTIDAPVLTLKTYTVAQLGALTPSVGALAVATDGDASLNWGDTVVNSGSGTTKYQVWYNGSAWTVCGK